MWFIKTLSVLAISALTFTAMALAEPKQSANSSPAAKSKCGNHTAKGHRWVLKLRGSTSIPKWAKAKHRRALHCAAGDGHRKVMKDRWRKVKKSLKPRNYSRWICIGRHEQPGPGHKGVWWSHSGPTYQGGLGIWYGNWAYYKPKGYPSNAGSATWRQQMHVANIIANKYGFSAWGAYNDNSECRK
jgi:hypothetical protein